MLITEGDPFISIFGTVSGFLMFFIIIFFKIVAKIRTYAY